MGTRRMRIGCTFGYEVAYPTPTVFQVEPHPGARGTVSNAAWTFEPDMPVHDYTDIYDNPCKRLTLPAGLSTLTFAADVEVPDETEEFDDSAPELPPEQLPDDTLIYTLPSRYCLPDVIGNQAWTQFGALAPGYRRVAAICSYVNEYLRFQYGASSSTSTAADVYLSGFGVCRDFAHLAITFCRALNIPARYVFGYIPEIDIPPHPDPMDFAAWMEVWLGDRWWTFDPRNNARRKGRVLIGRGRDASDVAMATTFGNPLLRSMTVVAEEVVPQVAGG
jgi:transglutaminase-like putative cysteine protease